MVYGPKDIRALKEQGSKGQKEELTRVLNVIDRQLLDGKRIFTLFTRLESQTCWQHFWRDDNEIQEDLDAIKEDEPLYGCVGTRLLENVCYQYTKAGWLFENGELLIELHSGTYRSKQILFVEQEGFE
jgi:hypothetical protein